MDVGEAQSQEGCVASPHLKVTTSAPAAAAVTASTATATSTSASAPRAGRRRIPPTAEVGVGAPLRRSIVVTHGAIDHRALDGAREDAADDLPEDLAAIAAKRAARIVIALDARAIARAFELAAAARHLADVGTDAGHLAVGLLQGIACRRDRRDRMVVGLGRGADRLLVKHLQVLAAERLRQQIGRAGPGLVVGARGLRAR